MRLTFFNRKNIASYILIFCIGLAYVFTAPVSIQYGDTGELVTNSYHLRVSHPPGYPLWTMLYHFPLSLIGKSNPYFYAALFTSFLSLVWITILALNFSGLVGVLIIGVLATSEVVWRYSILPDVFALHNIFLTLALLPLFRPNLVHKWWFLLLLSLGVAHHHTIIFVFPIFVYCMVKNFSFSRISLALIFGLTSLSIYCSLFFFNPSEYGSWDNIDSFQKLLSHFLREEYGTFRLRTKEAKESISWLSFFATKTAFDNWSQIILFVILFYNSKLRSSFKLIAFIILSCVGFYFLTFEYLGQIGNSPREEAVFERFLIQPLIMLTFLNLTIFSSDRINKWILLALVLNLFTNLTRLPLVNYRTNRSFENYLSQLLDTVPLGSVYYTYGDHVGFGTYYLKDVLGYRADIFHIHPTWGFEWGRKKTIKKFATHFKIDNEYFYKSFNFNEFRLFTNYPLPIPPDGFGFIIYDELREVHEVLKGESPLSYNCRYSNYSPSMSLNDLQNFEFSRFMELSLGQCFYDEASTLLQEGKTDLARDSLKKATTTSPYNPVFLSKYCEVLKNLHLNEDYTQCNTKLEEILINLNIRYFKK